MVKYFLMHKDDVCGTIIFDEESGRVIKYTDNRTGLSPYMGHADLPKIKRWWEMRAIPASRSVVQNIVKSTGCINSETYLAKNLALSMTDAYWVCPEDSSLKYDQVKFRKQRVHSNATSYDYNASLGGQMEKYWDLEQQVPDLVKESSKYYGQQSVNEVVATKIHIMQETDVPFVKYTAETIPGHGIISCCQAFTSEHVELISAYEILESQKPENSRSNYDQYIHLCREYGIDEEQIQKFMDYQTLTDFIISNTDEHLVNFGVLRNADTMDLIGPAPIYDSGNSMFYNEDRLIPYTRVELLARPITSFYKTEDKMLGKIHDRSIVKEELLPSPEEIKILYTKAGIPEPKAEFISENYKLKLDMMHEFQHGKNISLYHEKEIKQ